MDVTNKYCANCGSRLVAEDFTAGVCLICFEPIINQEEEDFKTLDLLENEFSNDN